MKMQIGRMLALALSGMMLTVVQPIGSSAGEAPKKIVVIGDSISAGTGLDVPNASYVDLVGRYYQAEVVNLAKDVCTTEDLLVMLDDPAVQSELSQADMILCTVGIQDIMEPFNAQLNIYKEELGFEQIEELYTASREEIKVTDDDLNAYSLALAKCLEQNEISCRDNILAIGEKLSVYSSNAEIVCPNVYNPLNCIAGLESMSTMRRMAYNSIMNPCNFVLTDSVNASYTTLGEQYGFRIIDTFTGFAGHAYDYTYLYYMEYNPSEIGHEWIAEAITGADLERETEPITEAPTTEEPTTEAPTTEEPTTEAPTTEEPTTEAPTTEEPTTEAPTTEPAALLGDVSKNGEVGAEDASEVLMLAAQIGAGQSDVLTDEIKASADVNGDGDVNAVDANAILLYAAAAGAGEDVFPETFFRN